MLSATPSSDACPTFVLMDIQGNKVTIYVYLIEDGKFRVEKAEFTKLDAPHPATPVSPPA